MRKLIGGSLLVALALVALGGAAVANAQTATPGLAARAASFVTRDGSAGPVRSSFASPFASIAPTVAPSISGIPEVDDLLTADPGTWPGTGLAFTYQWFDCDPSDPTSCTPIPNAIDSTYSVDPADGDSTIAVEVDAGDGSGDSGSATSAPTAVVTAQPGAPVELGDPTVGPVTGGETTVPTVGSWSNSPTSYTEAWLVCAQDLSSCEIDDSVVASGPYAISYTPTAADAGKVAVFVVIASNAVGDSVEAASTPSAPIAFPPPTVDIITPAATTYTAATLLWTSYSCSPPLGMTLVSCTGTLPNDTLFFAPLGSKQFTVTATDADGRSATQTVTYSGPTLSLQGKPTPPASISSPASGATVVQGAALLLSYSCPALCSASQQPNPSGTALSSGSALDTTMLGAHTVTVDVQQFPGGVVPASVTYTVVPPPLTVTSLSQSSAKWRAGNALPTATAAHAASHTPGTRFSFVANRPANVTYTFSRLVAGRSHGKACVAPTHANRHDKACTRAVGAGVMILPANSGANVVSFQGRLSSTARLRPGRYCVTVAAQATSPTGPAIQVGTLRFTVVK